METGTTLNVGGNRNEENESINAHFSCEVQINKKD